jgi:hypothetical protein
VVKIKRIGRPTRNLVVELLMDIRKPDLKELCMGPDEPYTAVWQSIMNSKYCYVVRDREGRLLSVFGIAAGQVDVGGTKATPIWFLGTNWAYRHNRALVYYGRQFCVRFIKEVGPLCNFIWAGNEPAIRYIQHLGAVLFDVAPMGNHGELFVPFVISEVK